MIEATGVGVARNYLAMGSGFYEAAEVGGAAPTVVGQIIERLQQAGLLTRAPEVDIFVNPNACQAIAESVSSIRRRGWHVRKAGKPEKYFGKAERTLHAKFLFGANWRENSDLCNSAWLYFGSGNLTRPGFSQKMSQIGGNLEVSLRHHSYSGSVKAVASNIESSLMSYPCNGTKNMMALLASLAPGAKCLSGRKRSLRRL
jgi:hypothetical protein